MNNSTVKLTLIGGPTILIETGGLRLLTDPTFDPPGSYQSGSITLQKTAGPALGVAELGRIDAVLLSHDQHADNLDPAGRALLTDIPTVLTTRIGAQRLGGKTHGLVPWETIEINAAGGTKLHVTATPARHGPVGIEPIAGDVVGFLLGNEKPALIYPATPFGTRVSRRLPAASSHVWLFCLRARPRRAGRFILPWTVTTRSRLHMHLRTHSLWRFIPMVGRISPRVEKIWLRLSVLLV